jgi:hypothetical protein
MVIGPWNLLDGSNVFRSWWVGFLVLANYRARRQKKEFVHEFRPDFDWTEPEMQGAEGEDRRRDKGKVLAHETVVLASVGGEMNMFAMQSKNQGMDEERRPRVVRRRQKPQQDAVVRVDENPLVGRTLVGLGPPRALYPFPADRGKRDVSCHCQTVCIRRLIYSICQYGVRR